MRHVDLCILGSGSGNSIIDDRFADWSVALVDHGAFGGTCLNVACIPTKMYAYPADLALSPGEAGRLGVDLRLDKVRWSDLQDRVFRRIDDTSAEGLQGRREAPNVTVFSETARFVGPRTLDLGPAGQLTADRFVIAAGSRPRVPPIEGLDSVDYHTSDTVMRLPELPASMVVLGGGYVAAEFAHIFTAYGTQVTVVNAAPGLLAQEDAEVAAAFEEILARRVDLRLDREVRRVSRSGSGVAVTFADADGREETVTGDVLLVATGRQTNADLLDLEAAGVEVDEHGSVVVDAQLRTTAEGVYALGDICAAEQLKHVANHQARIVQHNLLHPDDQRDSALGPVPHAIFSDPQVASVGLTEQQAEEEGRPYVVARHRFGDTAFGWAMADTESFVKVVADPRTGCLLGAHILGPQASLLIQPLVQGLALGTPVGDVARGQYWIHPALTEVVEQALLALPLPD